METKSQSTKGNSREAIGSVSGTADLQDAFAATLQSADSTAAQGVQMLQQVHQSRLALRTRTAATLTAKYGAGDPRAQAAQAAVTTTTLTVNRVAMVSQQLTTLAPQVSANGWALHGRVFDAQGQPLAKYTVFLVDSQNVFQESYGFTYTDETGYFLLENAGTEGKATSRVASVPLMVEIANNKGQPVYRSATAVQPAIGIASYQNIMLTEGKQPIGDPPAAIRAVGMPATKSRSAKTKREKSS